MLALIGSERVVCHPAEYRWLCGECRARGVQPPARCCTRAALLATLTHLPGARARYLRERLALEDFEDETG